MPLMNVMERGMRLPTIGKIRKGMQVPVIDRDSNAPKKDSKGNIVMRPVEREFFVFSIDPTQQAEVTSVLRSAYGTDQIRELNVFLAFPDAFRNFSFWLEAYNYNQLIARSDERLVTYLFDVETNEILVKGDERGNNPVVVAHSSKPKSAAGVLVANVSVGQPLPYAPEMVLGRAKGSDRDITFKAVGRLTVVIPELRRLATFSFVTGSYWYDIPQIYSTINIVEQICQATGRGANTIPMVLRRVEREGTYTDDSGAKKKKIRHDAELEIRGDIISGLLDTYKSSPFALALENNNQPVLPAGSGAEPEEDYDAHVTEELIPGESMVDAAVSLGGRNTPIDAGLVDDPKDEKIDPFSEQSVKWAAKEWNMDTITAAQELGKMLKSGKITAPMGKKSFKRIVKGE